MKVGFIGTGNMGGALARAAVKAVNPCDVFLSNRTARKAEDLAKELGCQAISVARAAQTCQILFLGVKPQMMGTLLEEIAPILQKREQDFVLVSMAAGLTVADIQEMAKSPYPVIRIMPNTPVAVGSGMTLYVPSDNVTEKMLSGFTQVMAKSGKLSKLPEKQIDAGSALSGCGPAFVCLFLESLADGAVSCGLTRQQAMEYATRTLMGTADLVMQTGQHPGALKDAVCSPGGSTIAGVKALEQGSFRGTVMEAVKAAYNRTKELGK